MTVFIMFEQCSNHDPYRGPGHFVFGNPASSSTCRKMSTSYPTIVLVVLALVLAAPAVGDSQTSPEPSKELGERLEAGPGGRGRDRRPVAGPGTAVGVADRCSVDPDVLGITRISSATERPFTMMPGDSGGFGASISAFLWPRKSVDFSSQVNLGDCPSGQPALRLRGPLLPESCRPKRERPGGEGVSSMKLAGMKDGVVALLPEVRRLPGAVLRPRGSVPLPLASLARLQYSGRPGSASTLRRRHDRRPGCRSTPCPVIIQSAQGNQHHRPGSRRGPALHHLGGTFVAETTR